MSTRRFVPYSAISSPSEANPMRIIVNGVEQEVPRDMNVIRLLQQLKISPDRIAVEINLTVIDRRAYHTHTFQVGDRVEIISFIGGGAHAG
ncbi:MAG: sulfur carrier protein ThiS [Nitrospiria bacterium]